MAESVVYTISLQDLLSAKLRDAEGNAVKLDTTMGGLEGTIKKFGAAVVAAFAIDRIQSFFMGVLDAGSKVEDATTGLTTLLKDSAAATQVVQNTMEDATKTPFAFEGLLSANKALISANETASGAREAVLNLANAIAATGGGDNELQRMVVNLQQIKNTGKATALDIKQFAYAGVNIYQVLANATGKPIEETKKMEVSYDLLTGALKKAAEAGGLYANGLENMSKNTSVRISNLGDAFFQLKVKMFQDLKPAFDVVISAIAGLVNALRSGWDWAVRNKEMLGLLASAVVGGAVGFGIYTIAVNASAIATAISTGATTAWTAAQWLLNAALTANPIGIVIVAIGALVGAVIYAWTHFAKFRAVVMGTWGVIKEFGSIVTDVFSGVWEMITGLLTFDPSKVSSGWDKAANAMSDAGKRMGTAFREGYEGVMADAKKQEEADAKSKSAISPPGAVAGKKGAAATEKTKPTKDTSPKGATGQKSVTINIQIGKLIEQFKVQTNNMQEGAGKVRELVAQTLLSAVNDSQITAGV